MLKVPWICSTKVYLNPPSPLLRVFSILMPWAGYRRTESNNKEKVMNYAHGMSFDQLEEAVKEADFIKIDGINFKIDNMKRSLGNIYVSPTDSLNAPFEEKSLAVIFDSAQEISTSKIMETYKVSPRIDTQSCYDENDLIGILNDKFEIPGEWITDLDKSQELRTTLVKFGVDPECRWAQVFSTLWAYRGLSFLDRTINRVSDVGFYNFAGDSTSNIINLDETKMHVLKNVNFNLSQLPLLQSLADTSVTAFGGRVEEGVVFIKSITGKWILPEYIVNQFSV